MPTALETPLPWWIAGPVLGLVIVALLGVGNKRFGVLGGVTDIVSGSSEGRGLQSWRVMLVLGKRFRLDEWYRRDRRRLERYRTEEQRQAQARAELTVQPFETDDPIAGCDMFVSFSGAHGRLRGIVLYNAELFEPATVASFTCSAHAFRMRAMIAVSRRLGSRRRSNAARTHVS